MTEVPSTVAAGYVREDSAAEWLREQGYRIVARRVRRGAFETDIVAYEREVLCFIEVRFRSRTSRFGGAHASLSARKRRHLVHCAALVIADMPEPPRCRFDVVAIDGRRHTLIRNAFSASEELRGRR